MERLDKTVSKAGGISRSDARGLILRGLVTVDGCVIRNIGEKVNPDLQSIVLSGEQLNYKKYIYLVMNKPKGVISAAEDKKTETIIDLLSEEYKRRNPFPVGRLDKNTTGLMIITDDGDFAHALLSPNKKVPKQYLVTLDGNINNQVVEEFKKGVTLMDGTALAPAQLTVLQKQNEGIVKITEGKYHQVKRMFGLFDLGVNELKRISFAGLGLPEDLKEGEYREITESEMNIIQEAMGAATNS